MTKILGALAAAPVIVLSAGFGLAGQRLGTNTNFLSPPTAILLLVLWYAWFFLEEDILPEAADADDALHKVLSFLLAAFGTFCLVLTFTDAAAFGVWVRVLLPVAPAWFAAAICCSLLAAAAIGISQAPNPKRLVSIPAALYTFIFMRRILGVSDRFWAAEAAFILACATCTTLLFFRAVLAIHMLGASDPNSNTPVAPGPVIPRSV